MISENNIDFGKGVHEFMIKTYVIDTNVLIQAPYALECFEDNDLVIPLVVLEELDGQVSDAH